MSSEDELVARLREGYHTLAGMQAQGKDTEEDARLQLIDPVVFSLYEPSHVRREDSDSGSRPDYVLYVQRITESGPARAIVEAKPLGTDFDKSPSGDRVEIPHRQAVRYLRDHAAANSATAGALTDGLRWRLYTRQEGTVEVVSEIDIGPLVRGDLEDREQLDDLLAALERPSRRGARGSVGERALRELAIAIKSPVAPAAEALKALGAAAELGATPEYEPVAAAELEGRELDSFLSDWNGHAHGDGPVIPTGEGEQETLFEPPRVRLAAVRLNYNEHGLVRAEVARCARIFSARSKPGAAVAFVWHVGPDGGIEGRLAIARGRRVAMTQPFDPDLPPPAARRAITRVLDLLRKREVSTQALADALDVLPLQRTFYEQVRRWVRQLRHDDDVFQDVEDEEERHEVLLRHLIRTLFVWILKEGRTVSPSFFEEEVATEHGIDDYHGGVLRFLFHERLNKEEGDRAPHPIAAASTAFEGVPFLNGSLFEPREGDMQLSITADKYWSGDEAAPGLFDILEHYHWTADEQRPGEREQTLDPELLSNLFEQLVADPLLEAQEKQEGRWTPKAPDGAYYTPMDVTAEMAADSLAAAVRNQVPSGVSDTQLLDLFRDPDAEIPDLSMTRRSQLLRRIEELRVFDPATGSGAFLLAALQALRTAIHKLHLDKTDQTRVIITNQLFGQDINPMAAQIARLRLFIALHHAERDEEEPAPLPNLEARIVCADTLFTHPADDYDPFAREGAGTFASADTSTRNDLEDALRSVAAVREQWPYDHSESKKRSRRSEDREARKALRNLLDGTFLTAEALDELQSLASYPLLELAHDEPARIDPRLLFAQVEGKWEGFDVVIGNPPYQSYRDSGFGEKEREALEARRYRTTQSSDLYTLFCEAALALARPDGGVVTLVVPLSIAFGQQEEALRTLFGGRCRSVTTRHYDNIPDTIFNQHPLFKGWKNKQRATILTAIRGDAPPTIRTGSLLRWRVADRASALDVRPGQELPQGEAALPGGQWLRIPHGEIATMLRAIVGQKTNVRSLRDQASGAANQYQLSLPPTGWYFVSAVPPGTRNPSRESLMPLPDEDMRALTIAALNGHVAYSWWRVFGDGFDVKLSDYDAFTIPDAWLAGDSHRRAIRFGHDLVEAIPTSKKAKLNAGQEWPNVDFFAHHPALIAALDRFHLESLGFDRRASESLLVHLRRMRSPDGWDF